MWRAELLLKALYRGTNGDKSNGDDQYYYFNPFNLYGGKKIFPASEDSLQQHVKITRTQNLLRTGKILSENPLASVLVTTKEAIAFFNFIEDNKERIRQIAVPEMKHNEKQLKLWVDRYKEYEAYYDEAMAMATNLKRIDYTAIKDHLKNTLSSVVRSIEGNMVLFFPFSDLKTSEAWFTILAIAMLENEDFQMMRGKVVDVCDYALDGPKLIRPINKYRLNVTYLLIDDVAWSGTQASQYASKIYNTLRYVLFDVFDESGEMINGKRLFKAIPYELPSNRIVFVRAAATPKAVEKFKTIVDDEMEKRTDIISLKRSLLLDTAPTSTLFTWCSYSMYKGHGSSATYAYTDHKFPDYGSSAVVMALTTGIFCPYMFHGAQKASGFRNETEEIVKNNTFDIEGDVRKAEKRYEWKTCKEYELTLNNGLTVFSASDELNQYNYRPFLKNGSRLGLQAVQGTDKYIFAFSDTACVLMSDNELWSPFWSNEVQALSADYNLVGLIDPSNIVWDETRWDQNIYNTGNTGDNTSNKTAFRLEYKGKLYIGPNFVEDKVQSKYVPGILRGEDAFNMQNIDPNGLIPAFALCHLFSAGGTKTWGRPEPFYKEGEAQSILNLAANAVKLEKLANTIR